MDDGYGVEKISFDWTSISDLDSAVRALRLPQIPQTSISDGHYRPLQRLASQLNVTSIAQQNGRNLATGYRDFAILTLEPAPSESILEHADPRGLPETIKHLDTWLRKASERRNWRNTCIIDAKPFRSSEKAAFDAVEEALETLSPSVLLLCQTGTAHINHPFARLMSSSVAGAGEVFLYQMKNGKTVMVICSLHPMYAIRYTRGLDPLVRRVRQAMIEFTILQAVNILAGRVIVGPGMSKLQSALWAADQDPHRLRYNGQLDPGLDTRFKGVFLSPNATLEMKTLWERTMKEKKAMESQKRAQFFDIVRRLKSSENVTRASDAFASFQGLREALSSAGCNTG